MRAYDPAHPLIAIHVPKAAGTSCSGQFQAWFGDGFRTHYFDEFTGTPPARLDLEALHSPASPLLLYGHFNRERGFGIEDYYPRARQFVTILRDPFELTLSHYFFVRNEGQKWKDLSRVPTQSLREHLRTTRPNMLQHFPRAVTWDNYRAQLDDAFVFVGLTERLDESLRRIAARLGRPPPRQAPPRLNATWRDQPVGAEMREDFRACNPLEFAVYDYAVAKFFRAEQPAATAAGADAG